MEVLLDQKLSTTLEKPVVGKFNSTELPLLLLFKPPRGQKEAPPEVAVVSQPFAVLPAKDSISSKKLCVTVPLPAVRARVVIGEGHFIVPAVAAPLLKSQQ